MISEKFYKQADQLVKKWHDTPLVADIVASCAEALAAVERETLDRAIAATRNVDRDYDGHDSYILQGYIEARQRAVGALKAILETKVPVSGNAPTEANDARINRVDTEHVEPKPDGEAEGGRDEQSPGSPFRADLHPPSVSPTQTERTEEYCINCETTKVPGDYWTKCPNPECVAFNESKATGGFRAVEARPASEVREALEEMVGLMEGVIAGDYKPDSFTLQPAYAVLGWKPPLTDECADCQGSGFAGSYERCDCSLTSPKDKKGEAVNETIGRMIAELESLRSAQIYCQCGGIILADTEDWKTPLCYKCWVEAGSLENEPSRSAQEAKEP